jgi:hypothetical protein
VSLLGVGEILVSGRARGDGETIRIIPAETDPHVDYQGVESGIGEDFVEAASSGFEPVAEAAFGIVRERYDPEVAGTVINLAVLDAGTDDR